MTGPLPEPHHWQNSCQAWPKQSDWHRELPLTPKCDWTKVIFRNGQWPCKVCTRTVHSGPATLRTAGDKGRVAVGASTAYSIQQDENCDCSYPRTDATKHTIMSANASSYRSGDIFLQQHGEDWKPVAYCSRGWPNWKGVSSQCVGMWTVQICHWPQTPGTSREQPRPGQCAPEVSEVANETSAFQCHSRVRPEQCFGDRASQDDVAAHTEAVVSHLPAPARELLEIKQHTKNDEQLQRVLGFIRNGWPEYVEKVPATIIFVSQGKSHSYSQSDERPHHEDSWWASRSK